MEETLAMAVDGHAGRVREGEAQVGNMKILPRRCAV